MPPPFTNGQIQTISLSSRGFILGAVVLLLLPWGPAVVMNFQHQELKKKVDHLLLSSSLVARDLRQKTEIVSQLEREASNWEKANEAALNFLWESGMGYVTDINDDQYQQLELIEEILLNRIEVLKSQVQNRDKIFIEEKFGEGPYLIEFRISSPLGDKKGDRFVVELASGSHSSHTVRTFLGMVTNKLWGGFVLVHHEELSNMVQLSPFNAKTSLLDDDPSEKAQLSKMAFVQDHESYPYSLCTFGVRRAPGQPYFYIKTDSLDICNERHDKSEEACFGMVVEGMGVIHNFVHDFSNHVGIKVIESVRLLNQEIIDNN